MPDFRCDWIFESIQRNRGTTASAAYSWTESWYKTFASVEAAIVDMRRTANDSWLGKRLPLLNPLCRVAWVRATSVDNPGLVKVAALQGDVVGNLGNRLVVPEEPAGPLAAQINCAVLVDFWVGPLNATDRSHHRRTLIRGLPRTLINGDLIAEGSPAFALLVNFLSYIGRGRAPFTGPDNPAPGGWKIRCFDPDLMAFAPITALAITGADKAIDVTAATGNLTVGGRMLLKRVGFPRGVNKIWRAVAASTAGPPAIHHLGVNRFRLAGAWDETGLAAKVFYRYVQPAQYLIVGLRNKKTGGGSRRTRGRRSVR